MSNPLKSIGKVFKKVGKFVRKNWKWIALAATVYYAGAAASAWGNGATSAAAAGGAATGAGTVEVGTLAGGAQTIAAGAETAGIGASAAAAPAAGGLISGSMDAAALGGQAGTDFLMSQAPQVTTAMPSFASAGSTLKSAGSAIAGFIENHPTAALMGGSMLASAFTPSQDEVEARMAKNARKRSSYFGVSGKTGQGVTDLSQAFRGGIINGSMRS